MVDADERVTVELKNEIDAAVDKSQNNTTLYRMRRKDMFLGKWIRHSSGYPTWFGRLLKVGYVRVERKINEEYHTDGKVGILKEHLIHYPFNKGIAYWFQRHNRYSSMEAEELLKELQDKLNLSRLISADPMRRRRILKQLAFRLPFRPFIVFCYLYFLRLGFLDGRAGLIYCKLRAVYEYMIDIKVEEFRRRKKGLPI